MEEHLIMTKDELTAQLATASKQITNLTILLNAQLNKGTNLADVHPFCLDAIATVVKLGNQACPVTIKMSEFNEINLKRHSGTVIHFILTTRDTRCVFVLMLLVVVKVKVLTCQCPCSS